ncbi:unnamed protein product [Parascedosporium putredinis]|uniref:Uncharacterized protein n=1 Tax=Parascedosporium putredinis TaxID=1442378 RepID=A0A9P1MA50_9PEZI|nr:unnamed protein product [Parascedosporium putredinis]CAI7995989.1 unnamed protein product [Parascedosporium putredinis]
MEGPGAAEVYDTNRFSQLYQASRRPSPEHLSLAADFLFSLFDRHSIRFAFLGGWAVYLRGGTRRTEDVDLSVDMSMDGLTAILMPEDSNLEEAMEMIAPNLNGDPLLQTGQLIPVIDIYHQFSTKLHVHYERRNNGQTDDYEDLEFLAETYPREIWALHPYLNRDHREAFWQVFAFRNADEYDRVDQMEVILGLTS